MFWEHSCVCFPFGPEKVAFEDLGTREEYFKEYYEFVKRKEGLNIDNLFFAKGIEVKRMCKPSSYSPNGVVGDHQMTSNGIIGDHQMDVYSRSYVVKNNDKFVEDKRFEEPQQRKSDSAGAVSDHPVIRSISEICFASIVPHNIRLVYLTKSLVLELLKQPDSFDNKVQGSFVRVKSAVGGDSPTNFYQLAQVSGITKTLDGQSPVKLQLLNMPGDIDVDLLSDAPFSEEECEALCKKVKVGQLNKPTVEELEHKARSLHEDLTKHMIAREKRKLQLLIDLANEKGRRLQLLQYLEKRQRLETKSEVMRLLNSPPKVVAESLEVPSFPVKTLDDRKRRRSFPKLHPNFSDSEGVKGTKACDMDHVKQDEVVPKSISEHNEFCVNNHSGIERKSASDMDYVKQDESPKSVRRHSELSGSEPSSDDSISTPRLKSRKNSATGKSSDDAALSEMLDELIRPRVPNCAPACVSSKAVELMEKGYILCLKEIPTSNFKDKMIPVVNDLFATLLRLDVDYTNLYGRVRNYIRCSARLAHIEKAGQGPSVEELATDYESKKKCHEKNLEAYKETSTSMRESSKNAREQLNDVDSGYSGGKPERHSRISSFVKMSEELKKSKNKMEAALDALHKRRKKWVKEREARENFKSAKSAL